MERRDSGDESRMRRMFCMVDSVSDVKGRQVVIGVIVYFIYNSSIYPLFKVMIYHLNITRLIPGAFTYK